jgi:hypothetical protein
MADPDGAGWQRERACAVPVYEDHLAFLRDLVREDDEERAARRRGRPRLRLWLQLAAAAAVGFAAIVVIATLAAFAVTIYLCSRAVMLSDIRPQSMSRSGESDRAG